MSNEALIRFGFFAGVFAIVAILEVLAPRRAMAASKSRRWISNLTRVLNLVVDKERALAEIYKVLKPGGRLMLADQVLTDESPQSKKDMLTSWYR